MFVFGGSLHTEQHIFQFQSEDVDNSNFLRELQHFQFWLMDQDDQNPNTENLFPHNLYNPEVFWAHASAFVLASCKQCFCLNIVVYLRGNAVCFSLVGKAYKRDVSNLFLGVSNQIQFQAFLLCKYNISYMLSIVKQLSVHWQWGPLSSCGTAPEGRIIRLCMFFQAQPNEVLADEDLCFFQATFSLRFHLLLYHTHPNKKSHIRVHSCCYEQQSRVSFCFPSKHRQHWQEVHGVCWF